jgi:hypothetical protein
LRNTFEIRFYTHGIKKKVILEREGGREGEEERERERERERETATNQVY